MYVSVAVALVPFAAILWEAGLRVKEGETPATCVIGKNHNFM